jgi:hypothetical protein
MKTIVRDIFCKVLIKNHNNIYCIFTTSENVKVLATHLVACIHEPGQKSWGEGRG